jgi:hypothetical protein
MNNRPLTEIESKNLIELNKFGFESVLLYLTETGLEKGILDAVIPLRALLKKQKIHDYSNQKQGQSFKVRLESIHLGNEIEKLQTSLYRPETKNGDPRIWFYGISSLAKPNDILSIFISKENIVILNLTKSSLASDIQSKRNSKIIQFLSNNNQVSSSVSIELLKNLTAIASKGLIKSISSGSNDNALGLTIEHYLGIKPNSNKMPDYKGIELKAGRSPLFGQSNRATLFACVPNWSISKVKSSKEILEKFGYDRGTQFKLYCQVDFGKTNSQGLMLEIEDAKRLLHEMFKKSSTTLLPLVIWELETLENRLIDKHKETFWIKAESVKRNGNEFFELVSITHTKNPNVPQFERLIREKLISLDHLIKRKPTGGAAEKGPLFRIKASAIPQLFLGVPTVYNLT